MATSIGTLEGILRVIDEFSAPFRAFVTQNEQAGNAWDRTSRRITGASVQMSAQVRSSLAETGKALQEAGANWEALGQRMSTAGYKLSATVTVPLVALGGAAIKAASDFESGFAGVQRTVDGVVDSGGKLTEFGADLRGQIKDLALEIPASTNELNRIATAAGQLGIKSDAIIGFTKVVSQMAVTTNLTADTAADSMARIANITQMPQENFDRLGASILALGQSTASTETEIVELAQRIAGAGTIAGLSVGQIAGIGAAVASVGVQADAGGTAVQKVLISISKAVATGSDDLEFFAKTAKMSAEEFATTWRTDAASAFLAFVRGLGEQGDVAFQTLEDLHLKDARLTRTFISLAGAGDLLAQTMRRGQSAFEENTALVTAAERRYATFASQLTLFLNQLKNVATTFGEALLPVLRDGLEIAKPWVIRLGEVAAAFGRLPEPIRAVALAMAALAAAMGPVLIYIGFVAQGWGALVSLAGKLTTAIVGSGGVAAAFTYLADTLAAVKAGYGGLVLANAAQGLSAFAATALGATTIITGLVLGLGALIKVNADVDYSTAWTGAKTVASNFKEWAEQTDVVKSAQTHLNKILSVLGTSIEEISGHYYDWEKRVDGVKRAHVALMSAGLSELLRWLDRVGQKTEQEGATTDRETKRATEGWRLQTEAVNEFWRAFNEIGPNMNDYRRMQQERAQEEKRLSEEEQERIAQFQSGIQHQIEIMDMLGKAFSARQREWIKFGDSMDLTAEQIEQVNDGSAKMVEFLFKMKVAAGEIDLVQETKIANFAEEVEISSYVLDRFIRNLKTLPGGTPKLEAPLGIDINQFMEQFGFVDARMAHMRDTVAELAKLDLISPAQADEAIRQLDRMQDEIDATNGNIRAGIRIALEDTAADIFSIWGSALADVLTGALEGVDALREAIKGTVAAFGSQLASSVGGVTGAAIGAAIPLLGAVIDAAFKKGPDEGASSFEVIGGELQSKVDNWQRTALDTMNGINATISEVINSILESLGGTLASAEFGIKVQGDEIEVFIGGIRKGFTDAEEAIGFLVTELFKIADVVGLSAEAAQAVKLAAAQAGGDLATFQKDIEFILGFGDIGKGETTKAYEELNRVFKEASETAARLGLDVAVVTDEWARQSEELKNQAVVSFGNDLLSFVEQYYGKVEGGEKLKLQIQQLSFNIEMAQLRMRYAELLALGALTAEIAQLGAEVFAQLDQLTPDFDRAGTQQRNKEREERRKAVQEARRAFREELELLELAAGGASEGLVDFVGRLQELDRFLEEQREAGIGAASLDRYEHLTLGSMLDEALGPVRDILEPLSEADEIRDRFAEIREQVTVIAERMGVAVQPYLDLIDAAEGSELARLAFEEAEAIRELTEARRDELRALQDLTTNPWIKRFTDIIDQINSAITGPGGHVGTTAGPGGISGLAGGFVDPAALAAGGAALDALGRDFLQNLVSMGVVLPGVSAALIEYNRQEAIRAATFLSMSGALPGNIDDIVDGINQFYDAQLAGLNNATAALQDFNAELQETFKAAADKFNSLWDQLFGADDPTERIKTQIRELTAAFKDMDPFLKRQFLVAQGVPGVTMNTPITTDWDKIFADFIGPKEAELIAEAIADALAPLRDYFDDLRTGRAGLTTDQRFDNTLAAFNSAIESGDMSKAIQFARLLTGDLGVAEFGSSTQAFDDLVDYVVLRLGNEFDPLGPPEDLLQETISDGVDLQRRENDLISSLLDTIRASAGRDEDRHIELIQILERALGEAGGVS